ncbi:hypothetical protein [uncultured Thiodictyon sp.]|jgi:hypothetical protein|uniref:hypothetical protein n=1 Tax=uncultured Thiodictyon sp. TaxID=1846217 RepID=UPI0025DCD59F|nr:hypothetical protein [uncultured Thiodictyon sp.]
MVVYEESGLSVSLPVGAHFRFADLPGYQALCGQHLKEMDFAWIDNGELLLLEVRDYGGSCATLSGADFVPGQRLPIPWRFQTLIDKLTDSLLMLLAAWAGTGRGQALRAQLPTPARARLPLRLVVAIELPAALTIHLGPLRDMLNQRLRGRIALADVSSVALLDYTRLINHPRFRPYIRKLS